MCLVALVMSASAMAQPVKTKHLTTELVSEYKAVAPGGDIWIAIRYTPLKGWHTYWQNPGDTGLPPVITWSLPENITVGEVHWPTPELQPYMGLMNYGYSDETYLLVKLHNGSSLRTGDKLPLKAHIDFLVCEKVCVPESVDVTLDLPVGKSGNPDKAFQKAFNRLPWPGGDGISQKTGNVVEFAFSAPKIRQLNGLSDMTAAYQKPAGAYFFPASSGVLMPSAAQKLDMGGNGFVLRVETPDDAPLTKPVSGVLKFANGQSVDVTLTPGVIPAGMRGLGGLNAVSGNVTALGVVIAAGLALLGGIILNLMPCVFPVLSMKILAVSKAGDDHKVARIDSLIYGLGVVTSFVALALMLNLAHALGAALGWGFQLQSPYVTAALSVLMLLVALNMSGLFNVGSSLQGLGAGPLSGFTSRNPYVGAFFTGVLAVVVAAPCTAPFMATAIGVALAQGGLVSLAIFVALGLGFALPIVGLTYAITYVPGLAKRMPRPGPWMDRLRQVLAVPMYLAAIWMVWVFAQQVSGWGLFALVIALGLITLAVIKSILPQMMLPVLIGLAVVLSAVAAMQVRTAVTLPTANTDVPHEAFSVERIAQLRAEGKNVLVDLTAAWCVSCKVNERLVFHTDTFAQALSDTNTVYMVGDWTNQDARISEYLSRYGRSGVPLYVWYGPNGADAKILPQLLNKDEVVRMMKAEN